MAITSISTRQQQHQLVILGIGNDITSVPRQLLRESLGRGPCLESAASNARTTSRHTQLHSRPMPPRLLGSHFTMPTSILDRRAKCNSGLDSYARSAQVLLAEDHWDTIRKESALSLPLSLSLSLSRARRQRPERLDLEQEADRPTSRKSLPFIARSHGDRIMKRSSGTF